MIYSVVDIQTGVRMAEGTLPLEVLLPDGGLARFTMVGETLPGHAPRYRCVERVEITTPPEYPHVVASETREFVEGDDRITRSYAPDIAAYQRAIEAHVDAVAQERGYSGAVSIATYVTSTNAQWSAEAAAFIAWRDAVWAHVFERLAAVQGGQQEPPTLAVFIGALPTIGWPE